MLLKCLKLKAQHRKALVQHERSLSEVWYLTCKENEHAPPSACPGQEQGGRRGAVLYLRVEWVHCSYNGGHFHLAFPAFVSMLNIPSSEKGSFFHLSCLYKPPV